MNVCMYIHIYIQIDVEICIYIYVQLYRAAIQGVSSHKPRPEAPASPQQAAREAPDRDTSRLRGLVPCIAEVEQFQKLGWNADQPALLGVERTINGRMDGFVDS